jgi:hypothetical protein
MIQGWDITTILRPGKSANSFDLPTNCYFCTAAALRDTSCSSLVDQSGEMQGDTGQVDDFARLFSYEIGHREYTQLGDVERDLLAELPTHQAVAFGYNRVNGTGHMIVVFKAMTSIGSTGSVGTPVLGNLRHIDYQLQNPQPGDGLLPSNENVNGMTRYHLLFRA